MKQLLLVPMFALASVAFANDTAKPATTTATDAPAANAAPAKKLTVKEAKEQCKAEGHKGKELKTCIKDKRAHG